MSDHSCQAVVVTCIDFRFQTYITNWLKENFPDGGFDRVAYAGAIFDLPTILKQIEISHRLHHIKQIILVNHEDCGAYGVEGNYERHLSDLKKAREELSQIYPDLTIDLYYLHLDGQFEKVD